MSECVICGSKRIERCEVTVTFKDGRESSAVQADVCRACGERYYDLATMTRLEEQRKPLKSKRRTG